LTFFKINQLHNSNKTNQTMSSNTANNLNATSDLVEISLTDFNRVFNVSDQFDPNLLKNGNDEQQKNELFKWSNNKGSSIFVQWVPDEFLPNADTDSVSQPAMWLFSAFGVVNRVEFVPRFTPDRKKRGHMAFIHFDMWKPESSFQTQLAEAHPNPLELNWNHTDRFGNMKEFKLRCCINLTPIRKVEYNASQLTDMFERLNNRVIEKMQTMQTTIDLLVEQNNTLRSQMAMMKLWQASMDKR
jgi:hypothetical protein